MGGAKEGRRKISDEDEYEFDDEYEGEDADGEDGEWALDTEGEKQARFHPYTLQGHFLNADKRIELPQEQLQRPIKELLERTDISHVKEAAEAAFGGKGLPLSPAAFASRQNKPMLGVGLPPDTKHMTEIQADAFIASFIPPVYASSFRALREVRKRLGSDWLQSRLKQGKAGELTILDTGGGGAALAAWQQILRAEWALLREKGEVEAEEPPPWKQTAIVASDRLRDRVKHFLPDTTLLPRLPDYQHSGPTRGQRLDAGPTPQPQKAYDIVVASHQLLGKELGHRRQAVLNKLWSVVKKDGGILIVVEKGHPRGFEAMAHARETVLKRFLLPQSGAEDVGGQAADPAFEREREPGHIIAPCTNQETCPMYLTHGESQGRKDFCHFRQGYVRPKTYATVLGRLKNVTSVEFSFVAIHRGVSKPQPLTGSEATRKAFDSYEHSKQPPDMDQLPRIISRPLKKQRHIIIDVCTPEAKVERWTVPKSYSKLAYHDARRSTWGDLWAMGAKTRMPRKVRHGKVAHEKGKPMLEERDDDEDADERDRDDDDEIIQMLAEKRQEKRNERIKKNWKNIVGQYKRRQAKLKDADRRMVEKEEQAWREKFGR
ncbi:hypothetical protein CDD83_3366 [Cordyceps sp. RAO-2017]|nr:hypothetical protein CDD83_3366 [Cordyceps sp. RAO-2017]